MCLIPHHKGLWPEKAFQTNCWTYLLVERSYLFSFFNFHKIVHFHKLSEYIRYLTEHYELNKQTNKHRSLVNKTLVPSTHQVLSIYNHSIYIFQHHIFSVKNKILNQEVKCRTRLGNLFIKTATELLLLPIASLHPTY